MSSADLDIEQFVLNLVGPSPVDSTVVKVDYFSDDDKLGLFYFKAHDGKPQYLSGTVDSETREKIKRFRMLLIERDLLETEVIKVNRERAKVEALLEELSTSAKHEANEKARKRMFSFKKLSRKNLPSLLMSSRKSSNASRKLDTGLLSSSPLLSARPDSSRGQVMPDIPKASGSQRSGLVSSSPLPPSSAYSSSPAKCSTDRSNVTFIDLSGDDDVEARSADDRKSLAAGNSEGYETKRGRRNIRNITVYYFCKDDSPPFVFTITWDPPSFFRLADNEDILIKHGIERNADIQFYEPQSGTWSTKSINWHLAPSIAPGEPLILAKIGVCSFTGLNEARGEALVAKANEKGSEVSQTLGKRKRVDQSSWKGKRRLYS